MKFAKEIERDLVPEWRLKYLDYRTGKKKLKAIKRALRNVSQTPGGRLFGGNTFTPSPFDNAPQYSFLNRAHGRQDISRTNGSGDLRHIAISNSQTSLNSKGGKGRPSLPQQFRRSPEEQPLNGDAPGFPGLNRYGSIIGSPPNNDRGRAPPSLKLPGAALDPDPSPQPGPSTDAQKKTSSVQLPLATESAFEIGKTRSPHRASSSLPSRYKSVFSPKRINSTPGVPPVNTPRPLMKRVFSLGGNKGMSPEARGDVPLEAYRDLDIRQAEFFSFLDMELEKVENFYREKEEDATDRLNALREQLHIMRDRRLDELITLQTTKIKAKQAKRKGGHKELPIGLLKGQSSSSEEETKKANSEGNSHNLSWLNPIDTALDAVKSGHYGKTTQAMNQLATPNALRPQNPDDRRDYTRRPDSPDVPYATAKRKLKVALQEYYRGLELLKSYALLNRTAFRKINKKYDKTVNARPSMRYMTEKVNKAWFVQSDVIDGHIRAVEDLYARYFERGNHKVAVGKLRVKMARAGDFTENSFRNGLFLAAGLVLSLQGIVSGAELLHSDDQSIASDTGYLFQVRALVVFK
ncbi:SPX-domain-containing protein [Amniculicola lignicola CBS 123094]|uniref:SPX-domain-containing protein n=1 Tax=Amniculicola lignicola CBS 123094 TaxID=1392246 RepID=A0A6A5W6I8_9PLEO|nr:SPX-domain-containing protein [Amniculicola lignicola CBS 123094]